MHHFLNATKLDTFFNDWFLKVFLYFFPKHWLLWTLTPATSKQVNLLTVTCLRQVF